MPLKSLETTQKKHPVFSLKLADVEFYDDQFDNIVDSSLE